MKQYQTERLILRQWHESDIESIENIYADIGTSAIISDCDTKIFFATKSFKTANKISQICLDKSKNLELISWQEAMNLAPDSQIILRDGKQPILSKKVFYYEDEEMKKKIIAL